jgi:hypothetical protein
VTNELTSMFALPDVPLPADPDGIFPALNAEQWVKWFRLQTTRAQIAIAAAVLELAGDDKAAVPMKYRGEPALIGADDDSTDILRKVLKELDSIREIEDNLRTRKAGAVVDRVEALAFAIRRAMG